MTARILSLGATIALLACATAKPVLAGNDAVSAERLEITDQTLTGFSAESRITLQNSGDSPMEVQGATYTLTVDGKPGASGQIGFDQTVAPGNSQQLSVPVTVELATDAAGLKALVERGDAPLPLLMSGSLRVTQGGKTQELPFSRTAELRVPRLPIAKMNDAEVARYDEGLGAAFYLGLENQNPFEIKVKGITYTAKLGDKSVGEGVASAGDRLPPSQTAEYEIEARIDADQVPEIKTVERGGEISYQLSGTVDLGITTLPFDLTGTLKFSKSKEHGGHKGKKKPAQGDD